MKRNENENHENHNRIMHFFVVCEKEIPSLGRGLDAAAKSGQRGESGTGADERARGKGYGQE